MSGFHGAPLCVALFPNCKGESLGRQDEYPSQFGRPVNGIPRPLDLDVRPLL